MMLKGELSIAPKKCVPCIGLIQKPNRFMIENNMERRSNAIEGTATHKKGILMQIIFGPS